MNAETTCGLRVTGDPMSAQFYTIPQLSAKAGLPRDWIRAACHRGEGFNPLPHIECGEKRPIIRIDYAQFEAWLQKETSR